ncbi:Crp/Fnr family transcriptional regulator [Marinobacter aromaticivorans]|uniref:Crp/Fnr family transcriptional regulator n=1 Tax=Marinobacter aromaticivorans TaxID=1494078 RepID=A0ABW2IT39_9GAMM|nr:Crp/Fnr family transcriptional regulator [Marinobacter aromaticivorans]
MRRKRTTPLDDVQVSPDGCSPDLRARILGNAPYFRGLPAQAIKAVNSLFRSVDYPAGAPLYHQGDPAEALFLVAHGRVKLLQHSASGNEVVLDLLSQGEPFGGLATLGRRRYPQTAVAHTACCVLTITTADFRHLIRTYPEVALSALDGVARDLEAAHDVIRSLSTLPVEARIAQVLTDLADRLGEADDSGILIQSPLSQQDLAAMVATTAATVSRIISSLRRRGYLETGRQWIRICDRDGLAQLAEDAGSSD